MWAYTIAAVLCALSTATGHYTKVLDDANEKRIYRRQQAVKVKLDLEKFNNRGVLNKVTEDEVEFWERELTKSSKSLKGSNSGKSKGSKRSKSRYRTLLRKTRQLGHAEMTNENEGEIDFFWERELAKSSKGSKSSKSSKGKNSRGSKSHHRFLFQGRLVRSDDEAEREFFWDRELTKSSKSSKSSKSKGSKSSKSHHRMLRPGGLRHDHKATMEEESQNDFFWDRELTKSYGSKNSKSSKSKGKRSKSRHRLLGSKAKHSTVDGQNQKHRLPNGDEAEIDFWDRALYYSTKSSKSKNKSKSYKSSKSGKSKGSKSTKTHYRAYV